MAVLSPFHSAKNCRPRGKPRSTEPGKSSQKAATLRSESRQKSETGFSEIARKAAVQTPFGIFGVAVPSPFDSRKIPEQAAVPTPFGKSGGVAVPSPFDSKKRTKQAAVPTPFGKSGGGRGPITLRPQRNSRTSRGPDTLRQVWGGRGPITLRPQKI